MTDYSALINDYARSLNPELPELAIDIPYPLRSSTLNQYFSQIEMERQVGMQLSKRDGTPFVRTFNVLSFPTANSRIERIDLGYYSAQYESDRYYRVIVPFNEDRYTATRDFRKWEWSRIEQEAHLIYSHQVRDELSWISPPYPPSEAYSYGNPYLLDYLPYTPPPLTDPPTPDPLADLYGLPIGYQLLVEANRGLGATLAFSLTNNAGIEVGYAAPAINIQLLDDPADWNPANQTPYSGELLLLDKTYILITLLQYLPIPYRLKLDALFYGIFKWTEPQIREEPEVQETLIHPESADFSTRLKPPGVTAVNDRFPSLLDWDQLPVVLNHSARKQAIPTIAAL